MTLQILKELYDAYKEMRKEEILVEVKNKKPVELYQLRKLLTDPPIFFIPFAKLQAKNKYAYEVIPHTEFVELARTYLPFPYYMLLPTETLVPLPFTAIFCPDFIVKYSKLISYIPKKDVEKALRYIQETKIPKEGIYRQFIDEERERIRKYENECLKELEPFESVEEAYLYHIQQGGEEDER